MGVAMAAGRVGGVWRTEKIDFSSKKVTWSTIERRTPTSGVLGNYTLNGTFLKINNYLNSYSYFILTLEYYLKLPKFISNEIIINLASIVS